MKLLVYVCRVLVGSLFIVSGLIKVNDALGFFYKLQEYAEPGAMNMPILDEWGLGIAIFVSIAEILLGVALLIGALPKLTAILSMVMMLFFTWLTAYTSMCDPSGTTEVMMEVNGVEQLTEIPNQCVLECGCFGNAIPLTATESFYKDLVLTGLLIPICIWALMGRISLNRKEEDMYLFAGSLAVLAWFCMGMLDWLFPVLFTAIVLLITTAIKRRMQASYKEWVMAAGVLVATGAVQWYTLSHLPLRDYRPYAEGNNLPIQMLDVDALSYAYSELVASKSPELDKWINDFKAIDPDVAAALKGKAAQINGLSGQARLDSLDALPAAMARMGLKSPEVATEFTFKNINTGQDSLILSSDWLKIYNEGWFKRNYELVTYDGAEVELSEGVEPNIQDLAPESYNGDYLTDAIMQAEYVFLHISKDLSTASTDTQTDLNALAAAAQKAGYDFYGLTSANYDEAESFRHDHAAAYPFAVADQIELKIVVRSNPGLVLLHKGTVVKKWAWRDVPAWDDVKGSLIP